MTIPPVYSNQRERAIASFDFIEIVSGIGYGIFWGGVTSSSNIFLSQTFTSHELVISETDTSVLVPPFASTLMADTLDIDMPINKSTILNGKAFIRTTYAAVISSPMPGAENANAKVRFLLKDVDELGGETTIATSDFSDTLVLTTQGSEVDSDNQFLEMDIDNKTIASGHILRLTMEYYLETLYTGGGSIGTSATIAADPLGATNARFGTNETTFKLYLPFKIDL